jgi:glycosyltransferase involved in cell wall biosynthesis
MPFLEPLQQFPERSEIRFGLNWKECVSQQKARVSGPRRGADREPQVTVIIPTYNRADLLPRALDSVLAQTFKDFEVLVIDDASTDNTSEVVQGYQDDRVRYLCQEENRGVSAARNRGLREAQGEFIAFLDSDDEWLSNKLECQVARYSALPDDVGLVYTGFETVRDGGAATTHKPDLSGDLFSYLLQRNFIYPTSGMMVKHSVVSEVGYFDEEMPANEDWDYYVRIAREYRIEYVDDVLMRYYAVSGHTRKSQVTDDDLKARSQFYGKYAADMETAGAALPFLLESARRRLVPYSWDPPGARQILWKAIALRPFAPQLYMMFFRSLLPHRVYVALRTTWRAALNMYA